MGYILGISCGYHDSAATLIKDGIVLGACEEERFTGIKHDSSFPHNTIKWLLQEYSITKDDLNDICFYEIPFEKIDRIETSTKKGGLLNYFNRRNIIKRNKESYIDLIQDINLYVGKETNVSFTEHHLSHAAYSYYTSPYNDAIIVSVDGVGEWETTTIYEGKRNTLTKLESIKFPHSLGMFYSTMTAFLGFKPNEGEYKMMGLAPYGDSSKYIDKFDSIITNHLGSFKLNMDFFTYEYSDTHMFNEKLGMELGIENRLPEEPLTQEHKDLAAAVQSIYEKYFFSLLDKAYKLSPSRNLCLSGGCAYNGTANGKILKQTSYNNLWIPPAPSDAGSAIGCALNNYYENNVSIRKINTNPYLGPEYSKDKIKSALNSFSKYVYSEYVFDTELIKTISKEITEGNIIGWFDGRMEFGARALGNRSILANPRDPQMKSRLNMMIKKREGFRPFAPMIIKGEQVKYFKYQRVVPYMNQVVKVKDEFIDKLPAITHIDNSARIQSLDSKSNPRIYSLLEQLKVDNEYPIVINTSFNLKDQTMALTPEDAIKTFLNCEMDTLVLGNYIVKKTII
jgi:carbamoyltransferase|tara:strand:- start:159 stop:1859 length:1701 start_codon:yes stop_codon:yes gene_type:complete